METSDNLETDGSESEREYKKYEKYLDKYTMRVLKEDFFHPQDLPSLVSSVAEFGLDDDDVLDKKLPAKVLETDMNESSEKENVEKESAGRPKGGSLSDDSTLVACRNTSTKTQEGEERRAPLFLQLLEKKLGNDKETRRVLVDAQCGICLTNVQEGDEIVWSRLECRHIHHRKCILPRLALKERRCPICPHYFATGASASSQTLMTYRFDPPGVRITLISTFGSIENSFKASIDPMRDSTERKDYVLARGEGFFFYPPGKWVTGRCNSNGYSFAYACVPPPGRPNFYEEKVWLQDKK